MTTAITERDQDAGATSTRYYVTRVVEIAGRTVRARVERGVYLNDSGAVAEVLTDRSGGVEQPRRRRAQQLVARHTSVVPRRITSPTQTSSRTAHNCGHCRDCFKIGVSGPTRRAEVRWDGHG
jgi:hypothetical protein